MQRLQTRFQLLALTAFFAVGQLIAQSTTSLRGLVSDNTGTVIPSAVVTISNPKTGFTRQTIADGTGQYQFPQINPGVYEIKVEKEGFRVAVQSAAELLVNTPTTVNFKMEIGNVTETVNVVSEAESLNTVATPFSPCKMPEIALG